MMQSFFPIGDGLASTIEAQSQNAYIFCAPETYY